MTLLAGLELDQTRKRLISLFIGRYLKLTEKQNAEYERRLAKLPTPEQEAVMELTTSEGIEEGLRQGRVQGLQQGLYEEALKLVLRLLYRKFGDEARLFEDTVRRLSLVQLEALSEEILVFHTLAELERWLAGS